MRGSNARYAHSAPSGDYNIILRIKAKPLTAGCMPLSGFIRLDGLTALDPDMLYPYS
jgi:hypothetical protein